MISSRSVNINIASVKIGFRFTEVQVGKQSGVTWNTQEVLESQLCNFPAICPQAIT